MLYKGQTLVIVLLLLILVIGGVGFYLYSQGFLSQMIPQSPQAVESTINSSEELKPTVTPIDTQGDITSGDIKLNITYPTNGLILRSTSVTVTGTTTPGADIFVNDQETKTDVKGNFSLKITLDEGINNIVVTANDDTGNVTEQNLSVDVQTF